MILRATTLSPLYPLLSDDSELWRSTLNWQPTDAQQHQFQQLYEAVLEGNSRLNLTRITDPDEFLEKHLWDSLTGLSPFSQIESVQRGLDIGTGAGFPGLPIAIVCPHWSLTLMDSTRKKVQFIEATAQSLGLSNVCALSDRAETIGHHSQHRESYDWVTIRAVAVASACAEYALPMLAIGGQAVLYRGQWTDAETAALDPVVQRLGGQIEAIDRWMTPLTQSDRTCIRLRKVQSTPEEFPRAVGVPTQKPL